MEADVPEEESVALTSGTSWNSQARQGVVHDLASTQDACHLHIGIREDGMGCCHLLCDLQRINHTMHGTLLRNNLKLERILIVLRRVLHSKGTLYLHDRPRHWLPNHLSMLLVRFVARGLLGVPPCRKRAKVPTRGATFFSFEPIGFD